MKPKGTMAKKAQRQLIASAISPPKTGPNTGPNTPPMPHIMRTIACKCFGKLANNMPWPRGCRGAPKTPCRMRNRISASKEFAMPQSAVAMVNPITVPTSRLRQPSRAASQPVIGVAIAVATKLKVMVQAI